MNTVVVQPEKNSAKFNLKKIVPNATRQENDNNTVFISLFFAHCC